MKQALLDKYKLVIIYDKKGMVLIYLRTYEQVKINIPHSIDQSIWNSYIQIFWESNLVVACEKSPIDTISVEYFKLDTSERSCIFIAEC